MPRTGTGAGGRGRRARRHRGRPGRAGRARRLDRAGYGAASADGARAARLVAAAEGIFLDPVFGAKAMAALIAECRAGRVRGTQVFLVSGGAPTLFAGSRDAAP